MRNFMDHASQRIPNLGEKKQYNPLLGHVVFYIGEPFTYLGETFYVKKHAAMLVSGTHHHESMISMPFHTEGAMTQSVGDFWFGAAQTEVFVTGLLESLRGFAPDFDARARAAITAEASRQAEAQRLPIEELLRPAPRVGIVIASW
jgi:hypothetical protein